MKHAEKHKGFINLIFPGVRPNRQASATLKWTSFECDTAGEKGASV